MPQYQRSESAGDRRDGYVRRPGATQNSFDHVVDGGEQGLRRDVKTERFHGFGVDDDLEFHRRLDRKLTGRIALQDAFDVVCCSSIVVGNVRTVGKKADALSVRTDDTRKSVEDGIALRAK
jgi:hypothetical protein